MHRARSRGWRLEFLRGLRRIPGGLLLPALLIVAVVAAKGILPADADDAAGSVPSPSKPLTGKEIPDSVIVKDKTITLNIPARTQLATRPCKEGWCGETAIQEILLFHGAYFPQGDINKAGKPRHPDLYSNEIPFALATLRAGYQMFPRDIGDIPVLLDWIRYHVRMGIPVLVGVKVNPTQHPEWGLDHFCTAVGLDGDAITFNTTGGRRVTRTAKQLASQEKGYSFKNRGTAYYALAVPGMPMGKGAVPVRAFVLRERKGAIDLAVKCEELTPGSEYVVYKSRSYEDEPKPFAAFKATGKAYAFSDTIAADRATVYRCQVKGTPPAKAGTAGLSAEVRRNLQTRLNFDFNKNALSDVVGFLGAVSRTRLVVDWAEMEKKGVKGSTPITFKGKALSVDAVLWRVLLSVDAGGTGRLGYVARDGKPVITLAPDPAVRPTGKFPK